MPVVDRLTPDYPQVRFIAVAGRSDLSKTEAAAGELLSVVEWGLDDSVWTLYGIIGQPASVLVDAEGRIVGGWYGAVGEEGLRRALDHLVAG